MKNPIRLVALAALRIYQISTRGFKSPCRFYPSCSEYSRQLFLFDTPQMAVFKTFVRLLRCNQFFSGGIDYPCVKISLSRQIYRIPRNFQLLGDFKVKFWLLPKKAIKINLIAPNIVFYERRAYFIIRQNFEKLT